MADEAAAPALKLEKRTFTRGTLDGQPCIVIYDEEKDETSVIAEGSLGYGLAISAFAQLEACSIPLPVPAPRRIIRPGMN